MGIGNHGAAMRGRPALDAARVSRLASAGLVSEGSA
jgi:hypothetical protein